MTENKNKKPKVIMKIGDKEIEIKGSIAIKGDMPMRKLGEVDIHPIEGTLRVKVEHLDDLSKIPVDDDDVISVPVELAPINGESGIDTDK